MSLGDVFKVGNELYCQIGELSEEAKAPLVPAYYADDYANVMHGCDKVKKRYCIPPQGTGKYPNFAMLINLEYAKLVNIGKINRHGTLVGTIAPNIMHDLYNCALIHASQNIKKFLVDPT